MELRVAPLFAYTFMSCTKLPIVCLVVWQRLLRVLAGG